MAKQVKFIITMPNEHWDRLGEILGKMVFQKVDDPNLFKAATAIVAQLTDNDIDEVLEPEGEISPESSTSQPGNNCVSSSFELSIDTNKLKKLDQFLSDIASAIIFSSITLDEKQLYPTLDNNNS